jgi:hypothetical protein
MDNNDDSFSNQVIKKVEPGNLSPIQKTRTSEISVTDSKNDQLFRLHKDLESKRNELFKKGSTLRENLALENCTFYPKINKFQEKVFENSSIKKDAFETYVERITKFREHKDAWNAKLSTKAGSGKNWKKSVTLSDGVLTKKFSASLKSKPIRMPSLDYDSNLDVKFH